MGFEDRDYFRESGYSDQFGSWGVHLATVPPVCKYLVAANIIVFLAQMIVTRPVTEQDLRRWQDGTPGAGELAEEYSNIEGLPRVSVVQEWAELDTSKVMRGQVWRLLTCAFCHSRHGVFHILFNMLFLWWFGKTLERMYGSREFLLFYLTAALVSSVAFVCLDLLTGDSTPAVGASGAVMAVIMLYAIFYPRDTIRIMFIFPLEIRWLVLFYVIYDLHPVLLALGGDQVHTGVAHAAHLGGLAFGFVYWKMNLRLEPLFDALRRFQVPRSLVAPRRPRPAARATGRPTLDDQVDHILHKIHQEGEDSLTADERQVLQLASERYQRRHHT